MPTETEAQSLIYTTSVMTINHVVTTPGVGIIGFVVELPATSGVYSCGVALNELGGDAYLYSGKGGWVPPQPGDDRVTYGPQFKDQTGLALQWVLDFYAEHHVAGAVGWQPDFICGVSVLAGEEVEDEWDTDDDEDWEDD